MKSLLARYKWSFIAAISIIGIFFILPVFFKKYCIIDAFYPAITAIGGFLFGIPIRIFWEDYIKPVLEIESVEVARFNIAAPSFSSIEYTASRIIIRNSGRRAATNCKGYMVFDNQKEQVSWVPQEPAITINAKADEKLDFCAFQNSDAKYPSIIAPTERGWPANIFDNPRNLPMNGSEAAILVTAENAEPISKRARFNLSASRIEIL